MYKIIKTISDTVIDFAAEELKKYLRMMMPECGDIEIIYDKNSTDGIRLGLMQNFGLDVSDAEDTYLDDILYIDCDETNGVIAGSNPRSVLLSVYEYLRQNDCRWLMPGIDGEYVPMQDVKPVKYRYKPSCRYRGWCSEGAQFQRSVLEAIELAPKLGMNVYMIQFINPNYFYKAYSSHLNNTENRMPEPLSKKQTLIWKRQCETEMAKRGLQFHDIGHGFNYLPFGISPDARMTEETPDGGLTGEQMSYLSELSGKRQFFKAKSSKIGFPSNTNFCMSNANARKQVVNYIVDFSRNHENIDYLHVWLADGSNNHCECSECIKKIPSDWYIILLNEIDEALTKVGLNTRIVFISYVDTTWAPLEEKSKIQKDSRSFLLPFSEAMATLSPKAVKKLSFSPIHEIKTFFPKASVQVLITLKNGKKYGTAHVSHSNTISGDINATIYQDLCRQK